MLMPQSLDPARRQFDRRPVKAPAFVHSQGRFRHATVVDYSQGSLQLEGTFDLTTLDPIQVELISGIRLRARVVWYLGCRTGIVFHKALWPTHPAMMQLSRRSKQDKP